jgi:AAA15 family ATPase/GTPase
MLHYFKIKNFRSIRDEVTLTMEADPGKKEKLKDRTFTVNNTELIKTNILYGRNASGKSNVLKALLYLKRLVIDSDKYKHGMNIPEYEPFIFDPDFANKDTEFEITFAAENGIKYIYEMHYNRKEFTYESLDFFPTGVRKANLFKREKKKFTYGSYFKGEKKLVEDNLLPNQLFLSKSASFDFDYLKETYEFFNMDLLSYLFDVNILDFIQILNYELHSMGDFKRNLLKLLKNGDTNIIDYEIKEEIRIAEETDKKLKNIITKHRQFNYGKESGYGLLNFNEESQGTQKLYAVSTFILITLSMGGVLIIDELDKSLHPLLTRMLINLFHDPKNNPKNAQLIFATHDVSLLDNEMFRRDQITFIEKEYEGNTDIYRLSDIKGVKENIPYEKWYMSGMFSAIPVIGNVELNWDEGDNGKT